MNGKVLLVDDDANLLASLKRQLRKKFSIETAQGGQEAVFTAQSRDPFAVVLCDMRMPGMDGIEVLKKIRELAPDTVRMMLTGNADQQTAINAINEGNIFRFFTKPCPPEVLEAAIEAGLRQYQLVTAERELLEKTLAGSLKVLVDVVSMSMPEAFCQGTKIREWVRRLTTDHNMKPRWQLDVAATLSQIGLVTIPAEIVTKAREGLPLTATEQAIIERAPEAGRNLIANIPRLAPVAEIVYLQDRGYDGSGFPADGPKGTDIPADARMLRILKDLAVASAGPWPTAAAFQSLDSRRQCYDPNLLKKLRECFTPVETAITGSAETTPREPVGEPLALALLQPGYYLASDIRLKSGHLVLAGGIHLSQAQVERLCSLARLHPVEEPVFVIKPQRSAASLRPWSTA